MGRLHFRWERNIEPDLKAYRLYRSENNLTTFSLLVEISQTEYVDRFLNYDSTYYYYLSAIDNAGNESLPTNIIDSSAYKFYLRLNHLPELLFQDLIIHTRS